MLPNRKYDSRHLNTEVVVYFSGGMNNLYQLEQWVYPFMVLNQELPLLIVVRDVCVYEWVQVNTEFQVTYCKSMDSLLGLYERNDFKCILYVNNASTNFQSLMNNRAFHVHINHGESEKTSTFSNRAKAYDAVFLVSDAGYEKYEKNLINISMERFIKVGRPQLDWFEPIERPKTERKILLYGATWEGAHLSMNYSSLVDFGLNIVETVLASDEYYLVYRPHPNTGSRDTATAKVDLAIRSLINKSEHARVLDDCDINAIFSFTDIALFDNSAIAVDFLQYDKPMIMTDYFYRSQGRNTKPRVVEACSLLSPSNIESLAKLLEDEISFDRNQKERREMKRYFLGEYAQGESTNVFIEKIKELIVHRNKLVGEMES